MRIDEVWALLQQEAGVQGLTALSIATKLGYARANVSTDLNQLVQEGKARKIRGKPVLYFAGTDKKTPEIEEQGFGAFLANNRSLRRVFSQAKAAILYPPRGMDMLILGEAGVGKSMFAEMLYRYAKKAGVLAANAPFIVFNCADYSNNPQLLLAHVFGSRKGAYTGAVEDKAGLVEQAQNGILFLDEVHRLPPEGQEIFFIFMDKGIFRRLGEAEATRTANVRIFAATTEDPHSQLLSTFLRRFTMILTLPPLCEREVSERLSLIQTFFNAESAKLKRHITVSANAMRALLTYRCKNNVGQLKSDIRFACAMAYAAGLSDPLCGLRVGIQHLPWYVKEDFVSDTRHREIWNQLPALNHKILEFDGDEPGTLIHPERNDSLYDMIDTRAGELKMRGFTDQDLEKELEKEVMAYFHYMLARFDPGVLRNVVDLQTLRLTEQIIDLCTSTLISPLSQNVYYGLAIHLENALNRIKENRLIRHPQLNKIRTQYPKEFNAALDVLQLIERTTDIQLPIDEAGFLAQFFAFGQQHNNLSEPQVQIIVAAHGVQVASAMTATAHTLLGVECAQAFDVPLEKKTREVLEEIVAFLGVKHAGTEVLFLVDMGSLKIFADEIRERLGMRTRTFTFASTMHVIEAIQSALTGKGLDAVYQDLLRVDCVKQQDNYRDASVPGREMKKLVVIVCSGTDKKAEVLHHKIGELLQDKRMVIEIKSCALQQPEAIAEYLSSMGEQWHIAALVTLLPLETDLPQFSCDELFTEQGIARFNGCIELQRNYLLLEDALNSVIKHVDRRLLLAEIKKFNAVIQIEYEIHYSFNILIGVTMHLACMIDRIIAAVPESMQSEPIIPRDSLYASLVKHISCLQRIFKVEIPQQEIVALHDLLLRIKSTSFTSQE